uniref:Receptor ligand binding region domain-containing protein n=1 Tax=Knipowitschia caucasica TaxID=637954 RepID=A0AAV2KGG1_KNICA
MYEAFITLDKADPLPRSEAAAESDTKERQISTHGESCSWRLRAVGLMDGLWSLSKLELGKNRGCVCHSHLQFCCSAFALVTAHQLLSTMKETDTRESKHQHRRENMGEGSNFLQLGASIEQQINGMFKVMEEYNWDSFVVITSLYPGYETFVDYIKSFTDTSYFLWELQDVLSFDMSADGLSDLRARRLLQQIDAQVLLVYCSHEEAQYLFAMAKDVGLVGPGYIWIIPSLAVGNPDIAPPESFPIGLISIITDRWRMSLRKRVRDGVAIVVKGVQSFRKQRGFIPEGHSDCHSPVKPAVTNDTLFR